MKYILLSLFLFNILLFSKDFSVGSYNVENLFDLNLDNTEYEEYKPNSKQNWNKEIFEKKLQNTSKVINDLDVDILGLQEIENENTLLELMKQTPKYKYHSFLKNKDSAIGVGLISKYKIINSKQIDVNDLNKYSRPILEVEIEIENKILTIFVCHWLSKRSSENYRIEYALSLMKEIKNLKNKEYIIIGDLNSNYDEYKTFINDKKLNNTYNISGINQILNTVYEKELVDLQTLKDVDKKILHYNLWLELPIFQRYSTTFKNQKETPDNIIISKQLFDNNAIDYIKNSFSVFTPTYLIKNNKINRWETKRKKFTGEGYSDHLPIYAKFSTTPEQTQYETKQKDNYKISDLYKNEDLKNVILNNLNVTYRYDNYIFLKQFDDRAIVFYDKSNNSKLKIGDNIDIKILSLDNFMGQKEITNLEIIKKLDTKNIDSDILDAKNIDIFDEKYQNEIITNLIATYKNGNLYYNSEKIKLYSKDKTILPKNGDKILILRAHLTNYKLKPQLKIYEKNNYKVLNNAN